MSGGGGVCVPHDALLLAVPVAFFFGGPLVELLLAFNEGNLAFNLVLFPIERKRDAGMAGLVHLAD